MDTLERILEIVEEVSKQQGDIAVQAAVMDERIRNIAKKVDKIDEAIFGNGKPGLKTDLERLEPRIKALEEHKEGIEKEKKDRAVENRKFVYGLYTLGVGVVIDIVLRLLGVY